MHFCALSNLVPALDILSCDSSILGTLVSAQYMLVALLLNTSDLELPDFC
jgi:hypothetical protein